MRFCQHTRKRKPRLKLEKKVKKEAESVPGQHKMEERRAEKTAHIQQKALLQQALRKNSCRQVGLGRISSKASRLVKVKMRK